MLRNSKVSLTVIKWEMVEHAGFVHLKLDCKSDVMYVMGTLTVYKTLVLYSFL